MWYLSVLFTAKSRASSYSSLRKISLLRLDLASILCVLDMWFRGYTVEAFFVLNGILIHSVSSEISVGLLFSRKSVIGFYRHVA